MTAISNWNLLKKPYRNDRNHKAGGGVAIYVKENIFSEEKPEFKINGLECVWVKIHVKGTNILFGNFYRPPDSDNQTWEKINYSIDLAINSNADKIIICGDFNDDQLNHSKQNLREICNQNSLYQIITDATYFCEKSVSLLDLIMVNDPEVILYSEVGENILENSVRYHCPISAVINIEKQLTKSFKRQIWQYHLGDYDLFKNELLKINWDSLIDNHNINTAAVNVTEKILEAAAKSIPNKMVQVRKNDPPWMNSNIRKMIRKRKRLNKKAKITNNEIDWSNFRRIRNKCINYVRSSKKKFLEKQINKVDSIHTISTKQWWKTIKNLIGLPNKKLAYPTLIFNNQYIESDYDKATYFNVISALSLLLMIHIMYYQY